jgi:hypothetical protein
MLSIILFILAIIALLLILYFNNVFPFDKVYNLDHLQKTYCEPDRSSNKCLCIVEPIIKDIESKYSKEELSELNEDKVQVSLEIARSFKDNKSEIMDCLKQKGAEAELKEFIAELFKVEVDTDEIMKLKEQLESLMKD